MRQMVSIAVVGLLLVGSISTLGVAAQESSLRDLLPTAEDIGPTFVVVDDRARTLAEQAAMFANPDEAARLLASWGWQGNAFVVFRASEVPVAGAPFATLDISLTRFASAADAAAALPYFLEDRAAVLGQFENFGLDQGTIGDEMRIVAGDVEGGYDTTLYVRSGPLLMRISATAMSGSLHASPEQIAQGIIGRFTGIALQQSASTNPNPPDALALPDVLSFSAVSCAPATGEGEGDVTSIIERFDGVRDAETTLRQMGWIDGVARQFACDNPPAGGVGWVTMSVLRFDDALAAAEAVSFLAESRARVTRLQSAPANPLGDSAAALAGSAVNGREYTLFVSDGPLLYRVTGVAPDGDPRKDVEAIATELMAQTVAGQAANPNPAPLAVDETTPTVAPVPAATALPTPIPLATATPAPTATLAPPSPPVPTATAISPPPPPPPTAVPTAIPTLIPVAVPPQSEPTATAGPLPTPTPRVIRIPTPDAD